MLSGVELIVSALRAPEVQRNFGIPGVQSWNCLTRSAKLR
jgi:thiamine pyrophosphate-dependent acetolactate synthase large subunit-like protein